MKGISSNYVFLKIRKRNNALFSLYLWLSSQMITITVTRPAYDQYEVSQEKLLSTLHCLCRDTSIFYEKFLNIKAVHHPIRSSDFVSQH